MKHITFLEVLELVLVVCSIYVWIWLKYTPMTGKLFCLAVALKCGILALAIMHACVGGYFPLSVQLSVALIAYVAMVAYGLRFLFFETGRVE